MQEIKVFFDGCSKINPGEAGAGYVVTSDTQVVKGYHYLGIQTNNYAEYNALILGLKSIEKLKDNPNINVNVYGDSNLVIKQMKGEWKVKADHLRIMFNEARALTLQFPNIEYNFIPREQNKEADKLSNIAVNLQSTKLGFYELK